MAGVEKFRAAPIFFSFIFFFIRISLSSPVSFPLHEYIFLTSIPISFLMVRELKLLQNET